MRRFHTDRWTNWARSISDRHERTTARQGLLVMTLLEPIRMFTSINQRFEKFAFALFPRIHVSISPILKELQKELQKELRLEQASLSVLVENSRKFNRVITTHDRLKASPMTLALHTEHTNQTSINTDKNTSRTDRVVIARETRGSNQSSQSPVARIFARSKQSHTELLLQKLLVEHESQTIAERVVREHSRLEVNKRGDMVIRKQISADVVAEKRHSEIEPQFASSRTSIQQPWPDKPPSLPQINVEQLTEHVIRKIDHRITAYRERLGRG